MSRRFFRACIVASISGVTAYVAHQIGLAWWTDWSPDALDLGVNLAAFFGAYWAAAPVRESSK